VYITHFSCIVHWKQEHFVVVYDIKQKAKFLFLIEEKVAATG
jgi:ABC-type bacteriocin/lantibiotic exporter with double-glycine peptidase domain